MSEIIALNSDGDVPSIPPLLRQLVDLRDRQIQKGRIQFSNRLSAIDREADMASVQQRDIVERYLERFGSLEKEIDADIHKIVKDYTIYPEVSKIKGIGPILGAKIIALIDITRCDTTSALWRFAGLAVINGERERLVAGEKAHYNIRLKTTMYLVAQSFMRSGSPYRGIYDSAKEYYQANRIEWTKGHVHMASLRKMEKVFLAHLWLRWRTLEGLSTRPLYVHEKLMHEHMFRPSDFGWTS